MIRPKKEQPKSKKSKNKITKKVTEVTEATENGEKGGEDDVFSSELDDVLEKEKGPDLFRMSVSDDFMDLQLSIQDATVIGLYSL